MSSKTLKSRSGKEPARGKTGPRPDRPTTCAALAIPIDVALQLINELIISLGGDANHLSQALSVDRVLDPVDSYESSVEGSPFNNGSMDAVRLALEVRINHADDNARMHRSALMKFHEMSAIES